jgi:hypothetical protein
LTSTMGISYKLKLGKYPSWWAKIKKKFI